MRNTFYTIMVYSVTGAQVYNDIKENYVKPLTESKDEYKKWSNTSGALNINRYYLILIGRSLELYLCKRLYSDTSSLASIQAQLEHLNAAMDTMSAKISEEDIKNLDDKRNVIYSLLSSSVIRNIEGQPAYMKVTIRQTIMDNMSKLYREILYTLEKYDMLTFKEDNPQDVLSDFGE